MNIDKREMAKNYILMGNINLAISREFFQAENEGAKYIDEMDRAKGCDKAE